MALGTRAIIIGAGRGQRLMPTTANGPKCFAEVQGKRILDWTVEALRAGGVDEICFIGGYRIDDVKAHYPDFTFRHNADWPNNNILASLMCAEDMMDRPFVTCYSDILFSKEVVRKLLAADRDIAVAVDTMWRDHYLHRTQHPPDDAEKTRLKGDLVACIDRGLPVDEADGEFIGVARFTPAGAQMLREAYHRCHALYAGKPFRESSVFEKAYLIQLLQEMLEQGVEIGHVETKGQYREIDTQEDMALAEKYWRG